MYKLYSLLVEKYDIYVYILMLLRTTFRMTLEIIILLIYL